MGGENLAGIREELDLFAKIRATIAEVVDILADMNARPTMDQLVEALETCVAE